MRDALGSPLLTERASVESDRRDNLLVGQAGRTLCGGGLRAMTGVAEGFPLGRGQHRPFPASTPPRLPRSSIGCVLRTAVRLQHRERKGRPDHELRIAATC